MNFGITFFLLLIILPRGKLWEIRRILKLLAKVKIPVSRTPKIANKFIFNFESDFDAQGSYTGVNSENVYEKPVQDADDL